MHVEGNYVYTVSPLPKVETMTPELLRRIKELVEAGATVLGTRPLKSPSLVDFPKCDEEVTRLADELWGKNAGSDGSGEHRVGKGRVVWGATPEKALAAMNVPAGLLLRSVAQGQAALHASPHRRRHGNLLRGQQDRRRGAGHVQFPRGRRPARVVAAANRADRTPRRVRTTARRYARAAAARTARVGVRRVSPGPGNVSIRWSP